MRGALEALSRARWLPWFAAVCYLLAAVLVVWVTVWPDSWWPN